MDGSGDQSGGYNDLTGAAQYMGMRYHIRKLTSFWCVMRVEYVFLCLGDSDEEKPNSGMGEDSAEERELEADIGPLRDQVGVLGEWGYYESYLEIEQ